MSEPPVPSERVRALLRGESEDDQWRQLARREIRTRMRALRKLVPVDVVVARSVETCQQITVLADVAAARVLVGYAAIHREIDPATTLAHALHAGKTVALPRVEADGSLSVLRYQGEPLVPDAVGVPSPPPDAELIELQSIDVVLVPALAVDARGHRLGYGRGFYDRLLSQLPKAVSIALVHPFQVLVELPDMPGDVPVTWIATHASVSRAVAVAPADLVP